MKLSTEQWLATAGFLAVVAITFAVGDYGTGAAMLIGVVPAFAALAIRKRRRRSSSTEAAGTILGPSVPTSGPPPTPGSSRMIRAFVVGAAASLFVFALVASAYVFAAAVPLVLLLTFGLHSYRKRPAGWPRGLRLGFVKRLWLLIPLLLMFAAITILQSEYVLVGATALLVVLVFGVRAHRARHRILSTPSTTAVSSRWLLIPLFLTVVMMGLANSSLMAAIPVMFVLTLATLAYLARGRASPPRGSEAARRLV